MEGKEMTRAAKQYVVATGSPFDGINLYGPFDTPEEAERYADELSDSDWEVVELNRNDD